MLTDEQRSEICERLLELWKKHPALRLGQLIGNVYHSTDSGGTEQYYAKDFAFIEHLEGFYAKHGDGDSVQGILRGG